MKTRPGISARGIAAAVGERYDRDPSEIMGDVATLLDEMVRESLFAECAPAETPAIQVERREQRYLAPSLQVYGDLDTLILSGE